MALLIVHVAERRAHVRVRKIADQAVQTLDQHRHVLILRQLIEMAGDASIDVQRESSRLVEQQELGVADAEIVAAAAGLCRSEEIVEVGAVPRRMCVPVESPVVHAHMSALTER